MRPAIRFFLILIGLLIFEVMGFEAHGLSVTGSKRVSICSFNIQFLGYFRDRQTDALSRFLKKSGCDAVVVQELVAPPDLTQLGSSHTQQSDPGQFPDGRPHRPTESSTDFFLAMERSGFDGFWLSEEDTGQSKSNQSNSTDTEWWVVFYKKSKLSPRMDLPNGFLDRKVTKNPDWDRVPYATGFETRDGKFDFVIVNVHLHAGKKGTIKRANELISVLDWVEEKRRRFSEQDYIVVGDMNFEDHLEIESILADTPFETLNTDSRHMTNTNLRGPKPYDHFLIDPVVTREIPLFRNFRVLDLIKGMKSQWPFKKKDYPGDPYDHNSFKKYYSDHHPVKIQIRIPDRDDD